MGCTSAPNTSRIALSLALNAQRSTPPPTPSPQGEGEQCAYCVDDRLRVVRCFASNADETPAFVFEMCLARCIVFGSSRKIVHRAVDLYRYPRFADGEVDGVAANLVLANNMHAFGPHAPQGIPSTILARAHAAAVAGFFRARRMSQMPARIIGIESSIPIVT